MWFCQAQIAYAVPVHFTFDDPPGAGLNSNLFNFKNEGSIANNQSSGTCQPGACPTSGVPGRIDRAVQFSNGQSIQISGAAFPQENVAFSLWLKPDASSNGKVLHFAHLRLD